jgi:hypothetical protein
MKWEDSLRRYCKDESLAQWSELAHDREDWKSHTDGFCVWSVD